MLKMLIYLVDWKDYIVGRVYTNEKEEYIYEPDLENCRLACREGMPALFVMRPQREWSKVLPPFIASRLKINSQYDHKLVTDYFSIIERK